MTHNQGKSHDVSTKTFQPKTLFPMFNNILTGPHHSTFLHLSLVRAVTVQLGTSVSDRLGIIHVHHKALELSQPSLSCVHLQSVLHSLSPDSFTCLEEKLRDQWRCSWRLPLMLPLLQIFSRTTLLAFHLKDTLWKSSLFFSVPWTEPSSKGSSQLNGVVS